MDHLNNLVPPPPLIPSSFCMVQIHHQVSSVPLELHPNVRTKRYGWIDEFYCISGPRYDEPAMDKIEARLMKERDNRANRGSL
jgi:hypothetical protein